MGRRSVFSDDEQSLLTGYLPAYMNKEADVWNKIFRAFFKTYPVLPTAEELESVDNDATAAADLQAVADRRVLRQGVGLEH